MQVVNTFKRYEKFHLIGVIALCCVYLQKLLEETTENIDNQSVTIGIHLYNPTRGTENQHFRGTNSKKSCET